MIIKYQVDYSRYTFKEDDDWGDYDNGKYREPWFNKSGYNYKPYMCTDGKWHQVMEHIAKWEYFNGRIPEGMEIDHIIPVRNGGTNKLSNLRLVTREQNANNPISLINKSNSQIERWKDEIEIEKQKQRLNKIWKNEEYKQKQIQKHIEFWKDNDEARQKYSSMFLGENNPNFGNKWNDKQRQKLSLFHKTNPKAIQHTNEINMKKRKPLVQVMPNGDRMEWESTREVGRNTEYKQSNVAAACRGENNHKYKNCEWYYKDET